MYPNHISLAALFSMICYPILVYCTMDCYICESSKSLEDCENEQVSGPGCKGISNQSSVCYIFQSRKDDIYSYGKHCIAARNCNEENGCPKGADECHVHCCSTRLCNKSVNAATSVCSSNVMLIILLALTLFYNTKTTIV